MTKAELISVAKEEIQRTNNLSGEYLNDFLKKYTLANITSATFENLDAIQMFAKYQLADEGLIEYNHNLNLYVWK